MAGVGLMVRVVGLGSYDPEFKSHLAVELIPGGVDPACHPSEVGEMSSSLLVYPVLEWRLYPGLYWVWCTASRFVPNRQGDCFGSTNALQSMVLMDGNWLC